MAQPRTSDRKLIAFAIGGAALFCVLCFASAAAAFAFLVVPSQRQLQRKREVPERLDALTDAWVAHCQSQLDLPEDRRELVRHAGPLPRQLPGYDDVEIVESDPGFSAIGFTPPSPTGLQFLIEPDPIGELFDLDQIKLSVSSEAGSEIRIQSWVCRTDCTCEETDQVDHVDPNDEEAMSNAHWQRP